MKEDLEREKAELEYQAEYRRLHEQACERGEETYTDPRLLLHVLTRVAHLKRGSCCKSGCRHCPYRDPLED